MTMQASDLRFFDCNTFFGLPSGKSVAPIPTVEGLLAEMDRAGIARALTWHISQHDASPWVGNRVLADAIAPHGGIAHDRLLGCWTILPNCAREFPSPTDFFAAMRAARVAAVRVFPTPHHYLLNAVAMGDWLAALSEERIPLFLSLRRGIEWHVIYALLAEFPDLTCVICDHGPWGADRFFRPLLARYPNVYVELSQYMLDGGIEALVADYGPERILFGSGFPESYMGGMLLALRHAQIPDAAKQAIAADNLERLLAW